MDHDPSTKNFLFRGNEPWVNASTFAWDELHAYMEARALENNLKLPYTYFLLDICLLNPNQTDEADAYNVELQFFATNPSLGKLISWPLVGDETSPWDVTDPVQLQQLAVSLSSWEPDNLPVAVQTLRSYLQMANQIPTVTYIHCGHGQDRTGELAGSYMMQYQKWSFEQTWDYNVNMGMDVVENMNAMEWDCEYLFYGLNYTLNCSKPSY